MKLKIKQSVRIWITNPEEEKEIGSNG